MQQEPSLPETQIWVSARRWIFRLWLLRVPVFSPKQELNFPTLAQVQELDFPTLVQGQELGFPTLVQVQELGKKLLMRIQPSLFFSLNLCWNASGRCLCWNKFVLQWFFQLKTLDLSDQVLWFWIYIPKQRDLFINIFWKDIVFVIFLARLHNIMQLQKEEKNNYLLPI